MPLYMFLLDALATGDNERHPQGATRTLLVFIKQDELEGPNFPLCESIVKTCGWSGLKFKGAALATPEAVRGIQKNPEPAIDQAYREAQGKGFGVLIFNG